MSKFLCDVSGLDFHRKQHKKPLLVSVLVSTGMELFSSEFLRWCYVLGEQCWWHTDVYSYLYLAAAKQCCSETKPHSAKGPMSWDRTELG